MAAHLVLVAVKKNAAYAFLKRPSAAGGAERWGFMAHWCLLVSLCAVPVQAERVLIDGVAAVVGRRVITLREVETEGQLLLVQRVGERRTDGPVDDAFRKSVLDYLIVQELLALEARRGYGIVVREAEVEQEVIRFQNKFKDLQVYRNTLSSLDISEESLRAVLRRELVVKAFLNRVLHFEREVTNQEVATFLREHPSALVDIPPASQMQAAKRLIRTEMRDAQFARLVDELKRNQEIRLIAAYAKEASAP